MFTNISKSILTATSLSLLTACAGNLAGQTKDVATRLNNYAPEISFRKAVDIAERLSGGKATEAELASENGKLVYEVTTLSTGKKTEFEIDTVSGDVKEADEDADLEEGERSLLNQLGNTSPLRQVISIAENADKGGLLSASLESEGTTIMGEVEFGIPTDIHEYDIDLKSGELIDDTEDD